jgi:hypothetical protein
MVFGRPVQLPVAFVVLQMVEAQGASRLDDACHMPGGRPHWRSAADGGYAMFAHTKKSGRHEYLQIFHNDRVDGKIRQRV